MPGALMLCYDTETVTGSPAGAAETVIATLAGVTVRYPGQRILLEGWADITVQAATTAIILRVRQDSLTGTAVGSPTVGPAQAAAANTYEAGITVVDATGAEYAGKTYVMTAQCTSAAGASTVNGVSLIAFVK